MSDDLDSDDNDNDQFQQREIREAVSFLIEITPDILAPQNDLNKTSQLFEILNSINDLIQDLVIIARSTGIGIYFYNCATTAPLKAMKSPPGFNRLFHLNVLNLTNMKALNDLIQNLDQRPLDSIFKYEPMKQDVELCTVLSKMIDEFMQKREFNKQRMIWITSNDHPFQQDSTYESLFRTINDFYAYGFFIEPIFLEPKSHSFDHLQYKLIFMNSNFMKPSQQQPSQKSQGVVQDTQVDDAKQLSGFSDNSLLFEKLVLSNQIRQSILNIKAPTGPACANGGPIPIMRPVPMVPPRAIIPICRCFNFRFTSLLSCGELSVSLAASSSSTFLSVVMAFVTFSPEYCSSTNSSSFIIELELISY